MSRYSFDSDPRPNRDDAMFYQEGKETSDALNYLAKLSDESSLQVSTVLSNGMVDHSGSHTGSEIAGGLNPEEEEGYLVAIYDWRDTEDPTTCPESEIYIAFSKDLPNEENKVPKLGEGPVVQGADEGTATRNLKRMASAYLE